MDINQNLNKAVFTTSKVIAGLPIMQVFHDSDGDWQFFSSDEEMTEENARIISLKEVIEIESSLEKVIENLPEGYEAYREDKNSEWFIKYDDGTIKDLN